ncbi:hypothetical protein AMJ57_05120 [Parcubacteria bacterium SG8_24]|nr:MAG: hypothetical protein AMJ57_05120 [Parcubacteria bacterium SG8_24]
MEQVPPIKISDVSFSFGPTPVLKDISLVVEQEDFLGLIGPNGGGKTTLLKIILGLLEPDQGTVEIYGKRPERARRLIGYVPQRSDIDFDFPISVLEVVLMGRLTKRGLGRRYTAQDREICREALRQVGAERFESRHISHLSGGQRQRVMIARAIASRPRLLLLDEPASSVDPGWQEAFYGLLQELNKEVAVVLVTHDVGIISSYVDKLACINTRLTYHGSPEGGMKCLVDIYEHPVHLLSHKKHKHDD